MKFLIILLLTLSFSATGKDYKTSDFKELMTKYLKALKNSDREKLKQVTTDKFYKQFEKTGLLDKVLKLQKKGDVEPFDLTFKKGSLSADLYLVNIKNQSDKNYGENWYYVRLKDGYLLLDEMHSLK